MTPELAPGTVIGGYRIEATIGRGGMGVVYRATQVALDRAIALKLIAEDLARDEAFRERFRRESKTLAQLDHPNVITVHEAGEHDGRLYIAMRFVEGTDLRELIEREGQLAPRRAAELLVQVAAALDAAHARGLVHRDVKPANVLIELRDGHEHAYLTDFGLTKLAGPTSGGLTATGQMVGTLDYVAPEQIEARHVDARTDVYALGCMLHTALSGRAPFADRDTQVAKMYAHLNEPPPVVSEAGHGIPVTFDPIVGRAMAKDPAERFPSAGDLGRAALTAATGTATEVVEHSVAAGEAAPEPTGAAAATGRSPERAGRPVRPRRRLLVAAGVVGAVAAVVALVAALAGGGGDGGERPAIDSQSLDVSSIPTGAGPTGVAVGEDGIWVANEEDATITPIDVETRKAGNAIQVAEGPRDVAAGEGAVWVLSPDSKLLSRVNPKTRRMVGRPVVVGRDSGRVAAGEGAVWVTQPNPGFLTRVDPSSGKPAGEPIDLPFGAVDTLATGFGKVWVLSFDDRDDLPEKDRRMTLTPVDAASREIEDPIDLDQLFSGGPVAAGEGAVWVGNTDKNVVLRVDPRRRKVVARIPVETGVGDLAVGGGAVWVMEGFGQGFVVRIDPRTNRLAGGRGSFPEMEESRIAVGEGAAWVTSAEDSVTRFGY